MSSRQGRAPPVRHSAESNTLLFGAASVPGRDALSAAGVEIPGAAISDVSSSVPRSNRLCLAFPTTVSVCSVQIGPSVMWTLKYCTQGGVSLLLWMPTFRRRLMSWQKQISSSTSFFLKTSLCLIKEIWNVSNSSSSPGRFPSFTSLPPSWTF